MKTRVMSSMMIDVIVEDIIEYAMLPSGFGVKAVTSDEVAINATMITISGKNIRLNTLKHALMTFDTMANEWHPDIFKKIGHSIPGHFRTSIYKHFLPGNGMPQQAIKKFAVKQSQGVQCIWKGDAVRSHVIDQRGQWACTIERVPWNVSAPSVRKISLSKKETGTTWIDDIVPGNLNSNVEALLPPDYQEWDTTTKGPMQFRPSVRLYALNRRQREKELKLLDEGMETYHAKGFPSYKPFTCEISVYVPENNTVPIAQIRKEAKAGKHLLEMHCKKNVKK